MNLYVRNIKPKYLLLLALIFGLINVLFFWHFFKNNGYLPAPFSTDKNDTFMDFYNPLYWVINDGFYTTFNSVYPALTYYLLKLFSFGVSHSDVADQFALRDANLKMSEVLVLLYLTILFIVINLGEWRRVAIHYRILTFFAFALSVPVLFGLERGNLIYFGLLFFALYLNAKNDITRAIYFGIMVNIKPYFIIFLVQYINKYQNEKKQIFYLVLISAAIFLLFGYFASISPINYVSAYFGFANNNILSSEGIISLPHSLSALTWIKNLVVFKAISFGSITFKSSFSFWFSLLKIINYSTVIILLYICIFWRMSKSDIIISTTIICTNFSVSTGGYVLLLYIPVVAYLILESKYRLLLLLIFTIFVLPIDFFTILKVHYVLLHSYSFGANIIVDNIDIYYGLGSIVRPIANYMIMVAMISFLYQKQKMNCKN